MATSPLAGKPAPASLLLNVPAAVTAYYTRIPDESEPGQRVRFGTSGHRGSSMEHSFNEWHVLAITQAVCEYRAKENISGPLFVGIDTHALSEPAYASALEVLAANEVDVMVAKNGEYTPTPAVSHAILSFNRSKPRGQSDGIVITPSHNPPDSGGYKYNPPHGGPAGVDITGWIEARSNDLLKNKLAGVKRIGFENALRAPTTHQHDFLNNYVNDLPSVIDVNAIRGANIRIGVDPLGGAGVHYWPAIADRFGLNLVVENEMVDPTFRFMTVDWDGKIRMDPSSPYAMRGLIDLKDRFDIAFACDTDHDRHGIVTRSSGLLPADHYLSVASLPLSEPNGMGCGSRSRQDGSQQQHDRSRSRKLGRRLYEVPVGFKWFVDGLLARARSDSAAKKARAPHFCAVTAVSGRPTRTGSSAALLSAEITACTGKDPGEIYRRLERSSARPVLTHRRSQQRRRKRRFCPGCRPTQITARRLGRRTDSDGAYAGAWQWTRHWRRESLDKKWVVCGSPIRHRKYLQDLRRKLSGNGSPESHP